jgi:hypothetical protein
MYVPFLKGTTARIPVARLRKAETIIARLGMKPGDAYSMMLAQIELREGLPSRSPPARRRFSIPNNNPPNGRRLSAPTPSDHRKLTHASVNVAKKHLVLFRTHIRLS